MHYYDNMQGDQIAEMSKRIRELEEINASVELALDVAWDEIEEGRQRECRLIWTVMGFGLLAMVAIINASWQAVGR